MNGKKAKLARKLAGMNKTNRDTTTYHGVEHTLRKKVLKDLMGQITHRYQTSTYRMNQGARLLTKMLKRKYKSQGSFVGSHY